jgi:hypothetical protein
MKSSIENSNLPENARSPVSSESRRSRPNSATPISDERADRSPPITTGAGAEKSWRCRAWSDGRDWAMAAIGRRCIGAAAQTPGPPPVSISGRSRRRASGAIERRQSFPARDGRGENLAQGLSHLARISRRPRDAGSHAAGDQRARPAQAGARGDAGDSRGPPQHTCDLSQKLRARGDRDCIRGRHPGAVCRGAEKIAIAGQARANPGGGCRDNGSYMRWPSAVRSPAQGPLPGAGLSIGLGGKGPDRTYRKKLRKHVSGRAWVSRGSARNPFRWPAVSSGRKQ